MQFEYNNQAFRLYRGVGSGRWMLLGELSPESGNWRLLESFDAAIHDHDIIDHAKNHLDKKENVYG